MKCKSHSASSVSTADSVRVALASGIAAAAAVVGAVFSAGNFSRRDLKALKVEREEASSFAFPRLRPRVAEAGIMDSRAESFFSGAEVVVVVRLIEAFSCAISALVRSRAVGLRRSGEGVGEGDGESMGISFLAGAGAGGGGDGDLVGSSIGAGFSFFVGSGALGAAVLLLASGCCGSAAVKFGLTFTFLTTGAAGSSPSSPPKLKRVFVALRFFLGAFVSCTVDTAMEACLTISPKGLSRTSVDKTLVGYSGLSESSPARSASAIFIRL